MKQLIKYFVLTIAAVLVLTACQNKSEDGNNKSDSSSGGKDKLVLYAAGPDDLVKDMVKEFERWQKVEVFQGTTGEILGRLEAEKIIRKRMSYNSHHYLLHLIIRKRLNRTLQS